MSHSHFDYRSPRTLTDDDFEDEIYAKGVWKTLWNLQASWRLRDDELLRELDRLQNQNAHLSRRTSELGEELANEKLHPRWRTSSKR